MIIISIPNYQSRVNPFDHHCRKKIQIEVEEIPLIIISVPDYQSKVNPFDHHCRKQIQIEVKEIPLIIISVPDYRDRGDPLGHYSISDKSRGDLFYRHSRQLHFQDHDRKVSWSPQFLRIISRVINYQLSPIYIYIIFFFFWVKR